MHQNLVVFIFHPSAFSLHPSSFILHPSSFTLHPSPFILHPSSFPMPRRALRKLDPALDLSFHLKTIEDLRRPFASEKIFQREAPLEVEVGSGKGLFLQSAAMSTPAHDFLGIEIAGKYARFAAARLAKLEVKNAAVVHGDAQRLFGEL